jgi:ribosomal protein S17
LSLETSLAHQSLSCTFILEITLWDFRMIKGLLLAAFIFTANFAGESVEIENPLEKAIDLLYHEIKPGKELEKSIFQLSMVGYYNMKKNELLHDDSVLTIIDYRKASKNKRFFVINLVEKRVLYSTLVAHGKGSGAQFAELFSNKPGSLKSSIGFFITDDSYYGKHGYSLKLQGVEPGVNDKAMQRAIVIHGASYVSESFIKRYGRLGRSWGCPALPEEITRQVIDEIKGGSCLFVYSEDQDYLKKSTFLNRESATQYYLEVNGFSAIEDTLTIGRDTLISNQP